MGKEFSGKLSIRKLMVLVKAGLAGKQDKLTGRPDQLLTFDENGKLDTISIARLIEMGVGSGSGASGGSGGLLLMSEGELEDTVFETGIFNNTGEGWNSYKFREEFEEIPEVFIQPIVDADVLVRVRDITKSGFLYCVRQFNGSSVVNTGSDIPLQYFAIDYGGER